MKTLQLSILSGIISLIACNSTPSATTETATTTNQPQSLMRVPAAGDPHWILLDSSGTITFNNRQVNLDTLQILLVDTLLKIKAQKGTMPDTILYKTEGTVMMGMRGAVGDVIKEAKEIAMKKK